MPRVAPTPARPLIVRCGAFGDMVMPTTLMRVVSAALLVAGLCRGFGPWSLSGLLWLPCGWLLAPWHARFAGYPEPEARAPCAGLRREFVRGRLHW